MPVGMPAIPRCPSLYAAPASERSERMLIGVRVPASAPHIHLIFFFSNVASLHGFAQEIFQALILPSRWYTQSG